MKKIVGVLICILILVGCSEEQNIVPELASHEENVVVYDFVKIFSESDNQHLQLMDDEKLIFTKSAKVQAVQLGDILVSGIASNVPYGYMRRIIAIQQRGEEIEFTTAEAGLNEVFESASVQVNQQIRPNNAIQRLDGDGYFRLKVEKSTIAGIFVEGQMKIRPDFEFIWEKNAINPLPRRLKMLISADLKDIELVGRLGAKAKTTLAKIDLPPITIFIGPVPVVFKNTLKLDLGGKFFVGTKLDAGVFLDQGDISAGLEYNEGTGWQGLGHSNVDFEISKPTEISSNLQLHVEFPDVVLESQPYNNNNFKFFGRALSLNKIVYDQPNITLNVTPRIQAGIKTKFFGFDQEYSYIHDFPTFLLYEGALDQMQEISLGTIDDDPEPAGGIQDISGHWAEHEIAYFINEGFMAGYPDQTFRPNRFLTRAEFAAMLTSVLNPPLSTDPVVASRNFSDISGHWAEDKILWAARSGYMAGYPDGTFKPNQNITKLEVVTVLSAATINNGDISELSYFEDYGAIPNWAKQAVANAKTNLLIVNYPIKTVLGPTFNATRADATSILYRVSIWQGNVVNPYESPYLVND